MCHGSWEIPLRSREGFTSNPTQETPLRARGHTRCGGSAQAAPPAPADEAGPLLARQARELPAQIVPRVGPPPPPPAPQHGEAHPTVEHGGRPRLATAGP